MGPATAVDECRGRASAGQAVDGQMDELVSNIMGAVVMFTECGADFMRR
jgi:hypothetical protein